MSEPNNEQPMFTKERFIEIEEELERDNEFIILRNLNGNPVQFRNRFQGFGTSEVHTYNPYNPESRYYIEFGHERELKEHIASGKPRGTYVPLRLTDTIRQGPRLTEEDTMARCRQQIARWESSKEYRHLIETLARVVTPPIEKIILFGAGPVALGPDKWRAEHAMALTVARILSEDQGFEVDLYAQEPSYTPVCKRVLTSLRIKVIPGVGARGLSMIDENTLIMTNCSAFAMRQVVAELGVLPAGMFWKPDVSEEEFNGLSKDEQEAFHDVDTPKTREMITKYDRYDIPFSGISMFSFHEMEELRRQRALEPAEFAPFSTWYFRKDSN
ncbi:hypothetical protein M426DRAFT_15023 [Hypoxylon sp. CI-4A]|nr:hypothetical protein M426DRAFT_15023 [Hypoxylon sp. CI-4A]